MARILIVDDDLAIRSIVADALRQDGYDVESVANGRQALTAFSHTRPDVVVLDLQMPGMDGPSLMRTLRAQTCRGIVPLVVVSGAAHANATSARLGARACLNKPFDLPELLATVEGLAPPARHDRGHAGRHRLNDQRHDRPGDHAAHRARPGGPRRTGHSLRARLHYE
jgi:CheY-like chemotaxis protein